ncbi:GDP-mannose 4,6-dehydratase [Fodinicurvata sediminis]|uniref:GDP-mannose 4,6-dehydratase n=1 Tax=Fodinicurvata sediminis TaxID=1121832 RepID=UPI0003B7696D|nr:GDP-mannose 4,6-dehydratase [Fodinicurvata sediminis]
MTVILTGCAGFIGNAVALDLVARGYQVLGIDNLNDYYTPQLKQDRLARLADAPGFTFLEADISDRTAMLALLDSHAETRWIVHLAAQAGVRYSLENPYAYAQSNLMGQVVMQELARHLPYLEHFVFASSSSVYGLDAELPFSEDQAADRPVSLYAATKRSDELMAHSYAHLYRIPSTGLRFFTVYGPWGRPDMAPWLFTDAVLRGHSIKLFNNGQAQRDFTYIDDIVAGVTAAMTRPPSDGGAKAPPYALYNLGNNQPTELMDFIAEIERITSRKAQLDPQPAQPGDMEATFADIEAARRDLGFSPRTNLSKGLEQLTVWFREYYGL